MWFLLEGNRPKEKNCYESNYRTRKKIRKRKRCSLHGLINIYTDPNHYNTSPPCSMLSGQLSKVFPNIPVGPNRNGPFYMISNRISWNLDGIESAHHFSHMCINTVRNSTWTYSFFFVFIFYLWKTLFAFVIGCIHLRI